MANKFLSLLLAVCLCCTLVGTAFAENDGELTEIDFMYMSNAWNPVDFGNDPVTKTFMEKTGVKLIVSAPSGDWKTVANVMLASGDYPSMMHVDYGPVFNQFVEAGALLPIDELAKEYGYNNIIDGSTIPEDVIKLRSSDDGHLYMVPNWFSEDGFGTVGQAVSVRNDLYTEAGNPDLKTVDDLYAWLESLRDQKLTYEGVKVWPLYAAFNTDQDMIGEVANMWGSNICRNIYYNEENQRVESILRNDTLLQALTFLNKCYNNNILDPESLTFDATQRDEAYAQGKYAVILDWFFNLWTADSVLSQVNPDVYYKCIPVPAGQADVQPYFGYNQHTGSSGVVVTKNCKDPEAAIRFISYYLSEEGQILEFYGIEGETCEIRDGVPYLMDGVYEAKMADWNGYALKTGVRVFDIMNNQKYNWERTQEDEAHQKDRKMAADYSFDASLLMSLVVEPTTVEGILSAEMDAALNSELTKIIIVEDASKIPEMVNDLLDKYEANGLSALEDEWTRQYKAKMD